MQKLQQKNAVILLLDKTGFTALFVFTTLLTILTASMTWKR